MQIDPDGRRGQTSSPPQTLWLNLTLRWEGGPLTLAEPLKFSTHARIRTRPQADCQQALHIGLGLRSRQLSSQSADQYGDIITESFLKHTVNMRVLVRGARACARLGGKETRPVLRKENPLSRA